MLEQHGQAGAPIVVVTDHAILRQFLAQGIISNVRAYKVLAQRHSNQLLLPLVWYCFVV
jgi:hypothetical protein